MDLQTIREALIARLSGDSQFSFLNTRLILRTGVDLSNTSKPALTPGRARVVLDTLSELGYDLRGEVGK